MQISCPQCATAYELDERVLPPGGAPVQCTRCSHVFTAEAPGREVPATQMFGAVQAAASGAPAPVGTQMFGAVNVPPVSGAPPIAAEEESPARERTQVYGRKNPLPRAEPAAAAPGAPAPVGTQMFGAVQAAAPGAPAPVGTQMFGAVRSAPAAPPPPAGTQIFGARTQIFGKGQIPPAPGSTLPLFPGASPSDPHVRGEQLPRRDSSTRERRRWRGSRWAIAVGSVAFIALGWVGVREWRARSTVLPAEALLAQSEAVNALRRDDAESIAAARAKLETLIQRWPRYLEARASHLSALLFQLDEARMEALRFTREAAEIDAEINVLREQKTPEDWEDRVATLVDRQAEIKAQNDRFADRAARRASEAQRALKEMPSAVGQELAPGDDIQLARAQALYFGVTGSEQALAVSERYRLLGGQEGWGEVASAAYALNAPVAPETRHQAREALEALRSRDPSWVRLYVMIGRLALEENAPDAAITALESALTLNPKHEVARSLLAQAKRRAKDAAAVSVSP